MIKSTANTSMKTQRADSNWDSVCGERAPGETESSAKRLIRPAWLHEEVGWMVVHAAEPREKIMIWWEALG